MPLAAITPHDAERRLLATTILKPDSFAEAAVHCTEADFSSDLTRFWWEAAATLLKQNLRTDSADRLLDAIRKRHGPRMAREIAKELGRTLVDFPCLAIDIHYYASEVRQLSLQRQLAELLESHRTPGDDVSKQISEIRRELDRLEASAKAARNLDGQVWDVVHSLSHDEGSREPLSTGYAQLDDWFRGGFRGGEMIVIAARPSCGKSALALCVASRMATNGKRILVVSLEMPAAEVLTRMIAQVTRIPTSVLDSKDFDKQRVLDAAADLERVAVVNEVSGVHQIRQLAKTMHTDVVIVDYIGKLPMDAKYRREAIESYSGELKALALGLDIPVLVLSQLNREASKSARAPQLTDLRECGALEQDADIVIMVHPESETLSDGEEAQLLVRKHRNGRCGITRMRWNAPCVSFEPAATTAHERAFDDFNAGF